MNDLREPAGWNGLGLRRYQRYVAAFDHAQACIEQEHYLEAIAVLDSLINDRLASRLGHLTSKHVASHRTTGQLCRGLVGENGVGGSETDERLRRSVSAIQKWVTRRNEAMHATAKVLRGAEPQLPFAQLLASHRPSACQGVELLRDFDKIDTALRRAKRKTPATFPGAFDPNSRPRYSKPRPPETAPAQPAVAADGRRRSAAAPPPSGARR